MSISNLSAKVNVALERMNMARQMSIRYMDDELYVTISGGKDSSVIQELALMAYEKFGWKARFVHSATTVDAPQTMRFVHSEMRRLRELGFDAQVRFPKKSMYQLIIDNYGKPPLRTRRYCCRHLKERSITCENGKKAFVVTGIRWAESPRRTKRGEFEAIASDAKRKVVLINDNEPERKLFEECRLRSERVVNPIIDWTDDDVWEFLRQKNVPVNPLYSEGFTRVGCIGCPMSTPKERKRLFDMFPRMKQAYIKAFEKGMERGKAEGKEYTWTCGQDVLDFIDKD